MFLKELNIYHDMMSLQDRILKSNHSANIFGDQMYLFGGYIAGAINKDLTVVDLKTLKVTKNCAQTGQLPTTLANHFSISRNNKIYFYGGVIDARNSPNKNIYMLDIGTLTWTILEPCSKVHSTAQVHGDNAYFFGGTGALSHNYLSIFNTSKKK